MEKQILSKDILEVKKLLPERGAPKLISAMVNGAYKPGTIKAMFNQQRTMNPGVFQQAKRLIEILNPENTLPNESNE